MSELQENPKLPRKKINPENWGVKEVQDFQDNAWSAYGNFRYCCGFFIVIFILIIGLLFILAHFLHIGL